ncbi:MAG: hypothetical protein AABY22_31650 [Nanoarchaeota archaeon]
MNLILKADGYKYSHSPGKFADGSISLGQYPPNMTSLFDYFESSCFQYH